MPALDVFIARYDQFDNLARKTACSNDTMAVGAVAERVLDGRFDHYDRDALAPILYVSVRNEVRSELRREARRRRREQLGGDETIDPGGDPDLDPATLFVAEETAAENLHFVRLAYELASPQLREALDLLSAPAVDGEQPITYEEVSARAGFRDRTHLYRELRALGRRVRAAADSDDR